MKRKSIDNTKKPKKQLKSKDETIIVSDGGDEMEPIRTSIKNPRNARPIVNSSGVVAYKVNDVQV
jgi:hypothetical protein